VTYYVLFFIHLDSRRVDITGITIDPGELWKANRPQRNDGGMRRAAGLSLSPEIGEGVLVEDHSLW
jgi:hypothetical protein